MPMSAPAWTYAFWTPQRCSADGNASAATSGNRRRASSRYGLEVRPASSDACQPTPVSGWSRKIFEPDVREHGALRVGLDVRSLRSSRPTPRKPMKSADVAAPERQRAGQRRRASRPPMASARRASTSVAPADHADERRARARRSAASTVASAPAITTPIDPCEPRPQRRAPAAGRQCRSAIAAIAIPSAAPASAAKSW